ncbi:MAG: crotonase/enoyl-CoA hydratase family protein [Gammaproteobacteria bacterium]
MSYVIASERNAPPSARRRELPSHIVPSTDRLDLSYDRQTRALWIYLSNRAPAYVTLELIHDLLGVDNVFATSLAVQSAAVPAVDFKVIASRRAGVFSLGGDLASFRYFIDQGNRNALTEYANAALDAIWTNTQAAGVPGMTTVSLVQGEAQGGGFEAALSAHVLVAEKGAMFGFPEALFGMFPGMGGYALLSARTTAESARRLIGSTNRYPAEMLYEMGVIDVLAEPGEGRETLDAWMLNATEESTEKFRSRFAAMDRNQLADSVDEWVEQALCLSPRQLRTMGYILEAQKRASAKAPVASITPLRRKIEFADICTSALVDDTGSGTPSPLVIKPQTAKRYHERELLAFVKQSRPWIYETLSNHGALVLRDFATPGWAPLIVSPRHYARIANSNRRTRCQHRQLSMTAFSRTMYGSFPATCRHTMPTQIARYFRRINYWRAKTTHNHANAQSR